MVCKCRHNSALLSPLCIYIQNILFKATAVRIWNDFIDFTNTVVIVLIIIAFDTISTSFNNKHIPAFTFPPITSEINNKQDKMSKTL